MGFLLLDVSIRCRLPAAAGALSRVPPRDRITKITSLQVHLLAIQQAVVQAELAVIFLELRTLDVLQSPLVLVPVHLIVGYAACSIR